MQGRELTAPELRQYVMSYVEMFKSGSKFPEAKTMLEATALANNQNARCADICLWAVDGRDDTISARML